MLREATSASNDEARLDDIETVPDDANLGAELDGAPPEVRAAAVRRSRRIPEPSTMRAVWLSLPLDVRDRIGVMALTHSFYSIIGGLDPQALTLDAGWRCERWQTEALNGIETVAMAALPQLYGTSEAEPLWAQQDAVAVACPVQTDPSPLTAAIAHHLQAERELAAVLGCPEEEAKRVAEDEAYHAVVAVQPRDRADLVALYEHLSHDCGEPAEEPLARALDALALARQLGATA